MGSCCSSQRSSAKLRNIRVVDLNGYVQDFDYPVMARQLTGKPTYQFVSTADKLLSSSGSKQLNPETQLQPGQIYFLLPVSTLKDEVSTMDCVAIVKKLTSIAKSTRFPPTNHSEPNSSMVHSQTRRRYHGNRPWKPILDPIREKSFNRRSESELSQEMQGETHN